MYAIKAKIKDIKTTEGSYIKTTEGSYKNILIAEKHKRRLEKRYPGTIFRIERASKKDNSFNDFYAVEKIFGRKEEAKSDKPEAIKRIN